MYILGIDTATIIQIFGTVVDGMIVSVVGVIDVTALLLNPPAPPHLPKISYACIYKILLHLYQLSL